VRNAQGEVTHYIGACSNLTEQKRTEQRIHHLAYYDVLTGLPNRPLFEDRLRLALVQAHRSGTGVAVLFLDLDRFKTINDSLGHPAGDQLLQAVAQRLGKCLREGDTAARWGGDEFMILLQDLGAGQQAVAQRASVVADKIQAIGEWVLKTALAQYRAWQAAGLSLPRISLNVSPRQFQQTDFIRRMQALVEEAGPST
jgi:diguanylate cyclase (GGDEF)-like protein